MANSSKAPPQPSNMDSGSVTATTQDILILLLPHLSIPDATALFQLCLSAEVLGGKDNGVQKRGYKILTKLVESGKVTINAETTLLQLDELMDGLAPAAKKVRYRHTHDFVTTDESIGSVLSVIFTYSFNPLVRYAYRSFLDSRSGSRNERTV